MLESMGLRLTGVIAVNLERHSTIPIIQKALRALKGHAHSDGDHIQQARERLEQVSNERDQNAILFRARATVETFSTIRHDIRLARVAQG